MKKFTLEYIREELKKKGYNLLSDVYETNETLLTFEKDGYIFQQRYVDFQQSKSPVKFGFRNKYAEYNIEQFIRNKYSENTEIVDIKRIRKKNRNRFLLTLKCEKCGEVYTQIFDDISKTTKTYLLCNKCNKMIYGKRHRKKEQELIDLFKENGYTLFPNQDLLRNKRLKVVDEDGYIGYISYNAMNTRNRKMSPFEYPSNKENYIYNINNWCRLNGIGSRAIGFSDKKMSKPTIKFKCECGKSFDTTKNSFVYGKCRCDECTKRMSTYEYKVKQYLEEKNIEYIYQYQIFSCRDVLPLPFDFHLKKYEALIEVDGEGHERPCHFNQISNEDAMISYLSTIKHDEIKNNYCKQYNIPLLRISYKDIKNNSNYKKMIDDFINTL